MRIAVIAGCEIRANWLFVAVMFVAALSGYLSVFLLSFVLVLVHEGFHALAARAFGFGVKEIELLPFGGVARIDGLFELNPTAEFVIALAGPACNVLLLMAALSVNAFIHLPQSQLQLFIEANIAIAALNLLPALPLDGGRMLRGLLSRHFDVVKVTRVCSAAGIVASALLAAAFAWAAFQGVMNFSLLLIAVFLSLTAWREYVQAPYLLYKGFTGKKGSLARESALPVREMVARGDMRLGRLVRRFSPGYYHVVTIVDADLRRLGQLDEEQILEALMSRGADAELGKIWKDCL